MNEPDVALTDFALALEAAVFVRLLSLRPTQSKLLRFWLLVFFASVGTASFAGGLVHGFFPDTDAGGIILWRIVLLAIGTATLAEWSVGAMLLFPERVAWWIRAAAAIEFVVYAFLVLFVVQDFWIAVVDNAPGAFCFMVGLAWIFRRMKDVWLLAAAAGMGLTMVSGLLQQMQVGLHAKYFNHNALYHVLQGTALFLVFLGSRRLVSDWKPVEQAALEPD
jgi:Family of unknown function (DUF6962)